MQVATFIRVSFRISRLRTSQRASCNCVRSAAWSPLFFSFRVGFRYLMLDLEQNGLSYDGDLSGFYIGVGFQF